MVALSQNRLSAHYAWFSGYMGMDMGICDLYMEVVQDIVTFNRYIFLICCIACTACNYGIQFIYIDDPITGLAV